MSGALLNFQLTVYGWNVGGCDIADLTGVLEEGCKAVPPPNAVVALQELSRCNDGWTSQKLGAWSLWGAESKGVWWPLFTTFSGQFAFGSVLTFAWAAAEYQFPVIEDLMARNDSSGEVVAKAGCSANYAQLLGDITKVFSDLSNSKIYCFESLTNKTAQRECAQNSIKSLEKVTAAIAEAANAMWQCFGIFWGCSQLMNSAYNKLSQAYYASFKMSSKCSIDKDATCDEDFYAFKALGSLSAAKGLLQSAQEECDIKGGTMEHPLNPWAATPFMPRKDPKSAE
eukprot:s5884_g3.t1